MTLNKLITIQFSVRFGFKTSLVVFFLLGLIGCNRQEDVKTTDDKPKVIKTTNRIEEWKKPELITLSFEEIYYGANYCQSVVYQMKEDKPERCGDLNEVLSKGEAYSKLSLRSNDKAEAYEYYKNAEVFLYKAVELLGNCNDQEFEMPFLI